MKQKTLCVTDLDGTLLRSDQKTSKFTNSVINMLVEKGMLFSYATARSWNTAHKVTEGMTARFPLIIYNGVFIRDNCTGEYLLKNMFRQSDAKELLKTLLDHGISPVVYSLIDGKEKFSYRRDSINAPTRDFVDSRAGDRRDRPVCSQAELFDGEIFYFTCIDEAEKLRPLYERYKDQFHCVFQKDIYTADQWLEIMPKEASKANAIRQFRALLGAKRLVVFGDGLNDIDMFQIADEAYAVENAAPELKSLATGIIGPNDEDGVAKWLFMNDGFRLREPQDLSWVMDEGNIFSVIDQTGSGCILFGIERDGRKYMYKIAGAKTVEAEVSEAESIRLLKAAVQVNRDIQHPALCRLVRAYDYQEFYVAVYEFAEGDCLFDHWNFDHYMEHPEVVTPMQRFHALPVEKRLSVSGILIDFMQTVIRTGYLPVDFYDSSLLYDFTQDRLTICDIDLFRKAPIVNEAGPDYWGTTRLKAPEENEKGAPIDEQTALFTLGAILFDFFTRLDETLIPHVFPKNVPERRACGHFLPPAREDFELGDTAYDVLKKATGLEKAERYASVEEFRNAWEGALIW